MYTEETKAHQGESTHAHEKAKYCYTHQSEKNSDVLRGKDTGYFEHNKIINYRLKN